MKKNKAMIALFTAPALATFVIMFVYPVVRTFLMSFFTMETVTAKVSGWSFAGVQNYLDIWGNGVFLTSLANMLKIWVVGGVVCLSISLLFAVILSSGIRGKRFFRAAIYLPNTISAVALATMWIQYVFSPKYGMLKDLFTMLGATGFAKINWLGNDFKFWAMLIAFCFGAVGYYMLIFLSGIEKIPSDLYEAATIDGAGKLKQFRRITLPLLKGDFKTNLTFWSINTVSFFVWTKMFSPINSENSTITPTVFMMNMAFGSRTKTTQDPGRAAAVGVTLAIFVLLFFFLINRVIREEKIEH